MGNILPIPRIRNLFFNDKESSEINNDENKESTTLIWFDPNIATTEDTEETQQQLRHINDYVKFHTDLEQCVTFIQSREKEKIFLITSGSKASQILPLISSLRQVDSIFIFCKKKERYEHLSNEYSKIIDIYVGLDGLCRSIKEQINLVDKQLQTFSVFDQHQKSTRDLTKESAEFLWFQVFNSVIARFPHNQQAKQQMIDMCKQYYRGNSKELRLIDQFEREYQSEEAIRWYSKQSFVYKLINKALRTEDTDLLYIFRFFISDLSHSLAHEHEKILSSEETLLTVYRGVKLDQEEFDKLKENQGKIISTNGYLSTSRVRERALGFAMKPTKRTDVVSVFFQIDCDIKLIGTSLFFADIARYSQYPHEEEVLFDLNACFRIESIEPDGSLQLIKMHVSKEGETITKHYIELTQKETEDTSVSIVFGRLMCDLGQYDKSRKYFEELLKNPEDEDSVWIEFNIGRALRFKCEWEKAREYYDRAYDRMMNAEPGRIKDSAHALNDIGVIHSHQRKYDEALNYHQRALVIRQEYHPSGDVSIATSLNNIGNIFSHQGKYDEALNYHQRALAIRQEYHPSGHVDIAVSLNNIGNIFYHQGKYDEALDYHQQALKMREKYYPSGHVYIAGSLSNIGLILRRQGKYDAALDYHQRSLKMLEELYPSGHVNIAANFNDIGITLSGQNKYDQALNYHQRALQMQQKYYPSGHADIATSLDNIGSIFYHQGKYDEALDYHQQALKMLEELYPSGHVDIAANFNDIGITLSGQNKYDQALNYHQRALQMQQKYYPSGHADIATSLNGIGNIFYHQTKYVDALQSYQQALKMQEEVYTSGHVSIGYSLNNIGACYEMQNEKEMALDYYQRALIIYKNCLPVGHLRRLRVERNIRQLTEQN